MLSVAMTATEAVADREGAPQLLVAADPHVSVVLLEASRIPFLRGLDALVAQGRSVDQGTAGTLLMPWSLPIEGLGYTGRVAVAALALNVAAAVHSAARALAPGADGVGVEATQALRKVATEWATLRPGRFVWPHAHHLHELLCGSRGAQHTHAHACASMRSVCTTRTHRCGVCFVMERLPTFHRGRPARANRAQVPRNLPTAAGRGGIQAPGGP